MFFLRRGGDCIIEEVTFEQRPKESTRELSGEEDGARRKALERECARSAWGHCGWAREGRRRRDVGKGHLM